MKLKNIFSILLGSIHVLAYSSPQIDGWENVSSLTNGVQMDTNPMEITQGVLTGKETVSIGEDSPMTMMALAAAQYHEDIVNLAQSLGNDPDKIIEYVRNNIKNEMYYGIKKGALLTLYERSGNDYDKCVLARELLKAADADGDYYFGKIVDVVFLDNNHGYGSLIMSMKDLMGVDADFTLAANKSKVLEYLLARNIPYREVSVSGKPAVALVRYKIVKQETDTVSIIELAGKKRSIGDVMNVASEAGMTSADILSAAGGTLNITNRSVKSLNEPNLNARLKQYAAKISKQLSDNVSIPVESIVGEVKTNEPHIGLNIFNSGIALSLEKFYGKTKSQLIAGYKPATDRAMEDKNSGEMLLIYYKDPVFDEEHAKLKIYQGSSTTVSASKRIADLNAQRLWVDFSGNVARLKIGDSIWYQNTALSAATWDLKFEMCHAYDKHFSALSYPAIIASNVRSKEEHFKKNNGHIYSIIYVFGAADTLLAKRQALYADKILSAKADANNFNADGSFKITDNNLNQAQRDILAEGLNVMGLTWMAQTHQAAQFIANTFNTYYESQHRIGKVAQEGGFYIDVGLQLSGNVSKTFNNPDESACFNLTGFFASAMEHAVIQQLQDGADSVSTVNALYYGGKKGNELVLLTNKTQVTSTFLPGYSTAELEAFKAVFDKDGSSVILASKNRSCVPEAWDWDGYGYVVISPTRVGMMISGNANGGYSAINNYLNPVSTFNQFSSAANYSHIDSLFSGPTIPSIFSSTTIPSLSSWDPVDLHRGTFLLEKEDITQGDNLQFVRLYNSGLNEEKSPGLGNGWTHNYEISATERTAWSEVLGRGTAEQTASMAVAIHAAKTIFALVPANDAEKARNWALTALITKWGVDGMLNNCVSVKIGKESMQFVKQYRNLGTVQTPNIVEYFAPPAGTNLILEKNTQGQYALSEPYADKFVFNADNKIASIESPFGRITSFTYNAGRLVKITDPYGRFLEINWTNDKISSVTNAGRTVGYTYTGDNLTSCTDTLGKVWKYEYDAENRMTVLKDPTNNSERVIVENIYSNNGQVIKQHSLGDSNKAWTMSYVGSHTEERDPLGNVRKYHYDENGFCTKITDALGRSTDFEYDAQGRLKRRILPGVTNSMGDDTNGKPVTEIRRIAIISEYDNFHNKVREKTVEGVATLKYEFDEEFKKFKQVLTLANESLLSDTHYAYEVSADGKLPRLISTTYKAVKSGDTDRISTVNSYFSLNGGKTNLPASITDEKGVTTTISYDSFGRITSKSTAGRSTIYADFDAYDNPCKITGPDGISETFTYNALGDVQSSVRAGLTSAFTYDAARRPIKTTLTGSSLSTPVISEVFYDAAGNINRQIEADGFETSSVWTAQQNKLSDTVGIGSNAQTTTYLYDAADRRTGTRYHDGKTVNVKMDAAGQVIESEIDGKITKMQYDHLGNVVKTTSPLGISILSEYDVLGNKVSSTDGMGKKITHTYNSFGEQTSLKNRNDGVFGMSLNLSTRTGTLSTPMGKVFTKKYAENTWDLSETIPNSGIGRKTTYQYDAAGRIKTITDPTGAITYNYDAASGQLQSVVEGGKSIEYTYDVLGRMTSSTAEGLSVNYAYTAGGKIKTLTYPAQNGLGAKSVEYEYDDMGRLVRVKDWANRQTHYAYDGMSRLVEITRPNGTKRTMSYDANGSIVGIEERLADGAPIMIHRFNYDADMRLIRTLKVPVNTDIMRESWQASYNGDNEFASWKWTGRNPELPVTPSYDVEGNMTYGPVSERTASGYTYDTRNRLLSCNGVLYTYDAEDNRSSLTFADEGVAVGYAYVYNRTSSSSEVLIRNKSVVRPGEETQVGSTYYIYGAGLEYEVTFDKDGNEAVRYYHADQVGSTIALTDGGGVITDRYSYDTWGYVKHTLGISETPFLYVGAFGVQTDRNGLVNMRARYYNPTTQTFINPDPLGFGGGMNWYQYAAGNPLTNIDATGLCSSNIRSSFDVNSYLSSSYSSNSMLNVAQNVLSVLGMIPGVGAVFDVANSMISLARGNYGEAASHMISAIPGLGDIYSAGKMAFTGVKAVAGAAAIGKTVVNTARVAENLGSGAKVLSAEKNVYTSWNAFQKGTAGQFASRS